MVRKNKLKAIRFFISFLVIISLLVMFPTTNVEAVEHTKVGAQAYYRSVYRYLETPNTFTATFKLGTNVDKTGVLLSNYAGNASSTSAAQYISIQINETGNVRFNWNNGEKVIVFDNKDYRTGEWEHITIVRDRENDCFHLYDKGVLVQTANVGAGKDAIGNYCPTIGNDIRPTGERFPFLGEIRDIAVYTDTLSANEVKAEYEITDKKTITKATNSDIMFNWVLEGKAQKLVYSDNMPEYVYDYSGNENHAYLCTSFHYYEVEDKDWYKATGDEYTFVIYPDIQETVDYQQKLIYKQNEWVRDHAKDMNLKFVLTMGDLTNGIYSNWHVTQEAFTIFDDADIPYSPLLGNHDYDDHKLTVLGGRDTTHFNQFFEYEDYVDKDWFVEAKEPGKMDNVCYTFSGGGVNYLVLALEFGPSNSTLEWASSVIDKPEYSDYRVIVTTHSLVGRTGYFADLNHANVYSYGFSKADGVDVNNGIDVWEKLMSKHDNIFMAFSGHTTSDTVMRRVDTGDAGNQVLSMLVNGQSVRDINDNRGATLILVCKVNEATGKMTCNYYDPVRNLYFCVENQFEYDFSDVTSRSISVTEGVEAPSYAKPGKKVEFEIHKNTADYAVAAYDKKGNKIAITEKSGTYSLTMPDTSLRIELISLNETGEEVPEHKCLFENKIVDDKFLANSATCTQSSKYYYSCNCGKAGTKTFAVGEKVEHIFTQKATDEKYLASEATCVSRAKYYFSCSCGEADIRTFEDGDLGSHTYANEAPCLDRECLECHAHKDGETHNWDKGVVTVKATREKTGTRVYTCSDCGATMTENVSQTTIAFIHGYNTWAIAAIIGVLLLMAITAFMVFRKKRFGDNVVE